MIVLQDGTTALIIAVDAGNTETVKILLDAGACIHDVANVSHY